MAAILTTPWHSLRYTLAGILAVAASLKAAALLSGAPMEQGWLGSRPAQALLVLAELLLASWFASGMLPEVARWAGAVPKYCIKTARCDDPRWTGSVCAYCDSIANRDICCEVADGDPDCTYTGFANCKDADYMIGPPILPPGTCGSCNSASFKKTGTCTTSKDATGAGACK